MRIAVVCPYAVDRPGGGQSVTMELVARYVDRGHDSWLVAPGAIVDRSFLPPRAAGIEVRLVGPAREVRLNRSAAPLALNPKAVRKAREAIAGADVVHLHEPFAPVTSLGLVRLRPVPVVGTFHAAPTPALATVYRAAAPVLRRLASRLAAVTAVSPAAADPVAPIFGSVPVIPNGVDVAALAPDGRERARQVVFVGRDDRRKGLSVLLAAWPAVHAAHPDARLVVVGARREGVPAGVEFRGRVSEAEKVEALRSSAVYCCPNIGSESFGIVALEGMAAGCAVVASDIPAFAALLGGDEPVGVLTPVGDVAALGKAVSALLAEPPAAQRLGDSAARRARRYDWDAVAGRYLEVLAGAATAPR